ncbi:hypothetical protein CROQUDRAFT_144939 [Cronartium quercuum f. sp. fusiforme G11]|uniref:Uncharacterized protein n=1 Tax=Cronartium quercuum f. sp. fusiforme G11 TaxID=708437 RepID=A0A9P6THF5_9BASI|nr:hypothetical protein CROQUDRAFT_144939 [Cronartium quercuum f. sp. fusiforme G11]
MEQHHTGSLRSLIKSKLFSPATVINNNQAQSSTQSNPQPQLDFDHDLVIVNRTPSFKKPQQIVSVQVQKPRLKLNNQTRRPVSSIGSGPKIFKVPNPNPGLHYGQSNHDNRDVLNITKPLISLPSHTPTSRQLPPAHGSIFIRPTLPQLGPQHLILTPNTHINSAFTPLVLSPTTQTDKSYPTLPSTFPSPNLTTLNNPTDTEPKPVRQKSVRRQTISSSSGLPPSIPAFDLDSIQSKLPLNTLPDPEIRPRSNSADLAEARKIILGLQSQVDIFKQNQQLPPSPPPSNSNRSNHSLGPIRPISPPLQHSQPSDQTIVTPSSPRDGPNPSLPGLQPALCSLLS